MDDCPRCHSRDCSQKNGDLLGGAVIVVCVVCRKAWLEGDDYLVDPGKDAILRLRARLKTIESEERHRRFMEDESDILWERVL